MTTWKTVSMSSRQKNEAINELHRLGLKYRNARKYKVEMVEVENG